MPKTNQAAEDKELNLADFTGDADKPDESEDMDLSFGLDEKGNVVEEDEDENEEEEAEAKSDEEDSETEGEEDKEDEKKAEADEGDESEGDEEQEEGSEDEKEDETAQKEEEAKQQKGHMVPRKRLNEVLAKLRNTQEQLSRYEKAEQARTEKKEEGEKEEYDFGAKEKEYVNLIVEGNEAEAAALRAEIDTRRTEDIVAKVTQTAYEDQSRTRAEAAVAEAAQVWEDSFPILKQGSENYDEAVVGEIVQFRDGFIGSGMNPVDAINKAAEYVLVQKGYISDEVPEDKQQESKTRRKPEKTLTQKIDAQRRQPTQQNGTGNSTRNDSDEIDVADLTDEEFDKLSERELARARGDFFAG